MFLEATDKIDLGEWYITQEFLDDYLEVVEDQASIYRDTNVIPPVALASRILGLILNKLTLPPGTVHTSQEVISKHPIYVNQTVIGWAKRSRPIVKGTWTFISVDFHLYHLEQEIMQGKTTVVIPMER